MLGMRRAEVARKFDEIVAFSEIEQFIDTPVKWYSSGMYTRLAFAVAAHLEPEVLIVDEVLAVGDAAFQKKCLGKMGDVAKGGRTVLFVSHNLAAVKGLCERAIWLAKGSVVEDGSAGHVVSAYLQGVTCHTLEQVWDDPAAAPGNEKTRILSARVRPLVAGEDVQISVETPLSLEFEFWNYLPGALLNFTAHLFTADGTCVFAAPSAGRRRPAGPFGVAVQIPADLLNDGTYSVAIQVIQDSASTLYYHPDVLTFTVQDSERGGSWFGKWPGVVRPKLEWVSRSAGEGGGAR
jgi:lipopolysaccharide transport system ATP-binding protein